jgi:hypothetical protein
MNPRKTEVTIITYEKFYHDHQHAYGIIPKAHRQHNTVVTSSNASILSPMPLLGNFSSSFFDGRMKATEHLTSPL